MGFLEWSRWGRRRQPNERRSEPRSVWGHPAHYGLFVAVTPGIGGLPWMRKWKRKRNGSGINTRRKRNESETNEPNTNPNGSKMQPKRSPKAPKTDPKRTQNQTNGFKAIQNAPSWLKLAQVLTPRRPMTTPRRPQAGFSNLRFP